MTWLNSLQGLRKSKQELLAGPSNELPSYEVLTYQIPVPLGDCSVHVLLQRGEVMKSFIMDGGKNDGPKEKAVDKIKSALAFIRKDLTEMNVANDAWKLDSWVVTHWDEDHYVGVMDLATEDKDGKFVKDALLFCGAKYKDDGCPKFEVSEENKKNIVSSEAGVI